MRKKRYGRLQKALADISLLAGSPADAQDHYTTAAELCRVSNDWLWTAAALQGIAHAKVCHFHTTLFAACSNPQQHGPATLPVWSQTSTSAHCFSSFLGFFTLSDRHSSLSEEDPHSFQ